MGGEYTLRNGLSSTNQYPSGQSDKGRKQPRIGERMSAFSVNGLPDKFHQVMHRPILDCESALAPSRPIRLLVSESSRKRWKERSVASRIAPSSDMAVK